MQCGRGECREGVEYGCGEVRACGDWSECGCGGGVGQGGAVIGVVSGCVVVGARVWGMMRLVKLGLMREVGGGEPARAGARTGRRTEGDHNEAGWANCTNESTQVCVERGGEVLGVWRAGGAADFDR